jgi:hypothetical protein
VRLWALACAPSAVSRTISSRAWTRTCGSGADAESPVTRWSESSRAVARTTSSRSWRASRRESSRSATAAGPTPFLNRYQFSAQNGETVVKLDAEVELPGAAALLPQLAGRLVKKDVNDNLATLKETLEAVRP